LCEEVAQKLKSTKATQASRDRAMKSDAVEHRMQLSKPFDRPCLQTVQGVRVEDFASG
jgi:hypothetical protein